MDYSRWSVPPEDAWRLLIEPMDHSESRVAADAVTAALPHVQAIPIDPRKYLLLAWSRSGVEMFVEALTMLREAGRPVHQGMIDDLMGWLDRADPYLPDDDVWTAK